MSAPTELELDILCAALIVVFYGFWGFRWHWNFPQRNGPGFFLGVQVPPGFYEGPGLRWLMGYHITVIALFGVIAVGLAAIVLTGRWDLTPVWAGGSAPVFVVTLMAFVFWTRRKLGARPPVLPRVAAPLEARRLGDYISWPVEALTVGIIAVSWLLLLFRGDAHIDWQNPVTTTWLALGLLPGKIILVRSGIPLPPERTEEHYRLSEIQRRYSLWYLNAFGWGLVVSLAVFAVKHGWAAAEGSWLSWMLVVIALVPWLVLGAVIIRGQARLTAMGRDLRPAGSWATPFRPARLMLPGGVAWFGIWFGGFMLLMILFRG